MFGLVSVGLICVVSGDAYVRYAEQLFSSAREHLKIPHKTYLLEGREGWPAATLYRYHAIRERFSSLKGDHLFLCDADMRFESAVGEEILGEFVATRHPGYVGQKNLPFERRASSVACVSNGKVYYAGGFVGGERESFLGLVLRMTQQIDHDDEAGVLARWHDESHLNRILNDHPPSVSLSPSYCFPDDASGYPWLKGQERKLVALDKTPAERNGR